MLDWKSLLKYLFEGLAVAVATWLIPSKQFKLTYVEVIMIALTAAAVFALLDVFSPTVGFGARYGSGFSIGYQQIGMGTPEGVTAVHDLTYPVDSVLEPNGAPFPEIQDGGATYNATITFTAPKTTAELRTGRASQLGLFGNLPQEFQGGGASTYPVTITFATPQTATELRTGRAAKIGIVPFIAENQMGGAVTYPAKITFIASTPTPAPSTELRTGRSSQLGLLPFMTHEQLGTVGGGGEEKKSVNATMTFVKPVAEDETQKTYEVIIGFPSEQPDAQEAYSALVSFAKDN